MDYPENEQEKDRKSDKENQLQKQKVPNAKGISRICKRREMHGLTENFDNPEGLSNR